MVVACLGDAQLHEDAVDVLLDRRLGYPQLPRDVDTLTISYTFYYNELATK